MSAKSSFFGLNLRSAVAVLVAAFLLFGAASPASAARSVPSAAAAPITATHGALSLAPNFESPSLRTVSIAAVGPLSPQTGVSTRGAVPVRSSIPWYQRWGAFAGCIFGVGIPIGAAIGLFQGSVAAYVAGQAARPLQVTIGATASRYLDFAAWACRTAMYR